MLGLRGWAFCIDAAFCLSRRLWQRRLAIVKATWSGFFRLATLLSVGYLVYDRIYETSVAISSETADAGQPFRIPFTVTNNSHLFWIS